ncbi:MAG: transposase [Sulfurimonas sp.]
MIENIELLRESFKHVKHQFSFTIDAIVILPDHIHTIVTFEDVKEYPKIIGSLKRYFSSHCDPKHYQHLIQSHSREVQNYKPIWQKRFYEHAIRDEKDYKIRLDYIHYNPVKHGLAGKVSDWEYSSFQKFVEKGYYDNDWGAFDESIDFE